MGPHLITAGWDGDIALPSPAVLPWVVVVAVSGIVAHLSITTALTLAPASIVGPIDFVRLPVVAVVGMLVFNESLEALVFVGAGLIFVGNFLNLQSEAKKRNLRQRKSTGL